MCLSVSQAWTFQWDFSTLEVNTATHHIECLQLPVNALHSVTPTWKVKEVVLHKLFGYVRLGGQPCWVCELELWPFVR